MNRRVDDIGAGPVHFPHLVRCISVREDEKNRLVVGQNYILDLCTLYIDCDGDAYARCYTFDLKEIGMSLLKHFESIA